MRSLSPAVFQIAMDEIRDKSKKRIYQTDFDAWQADVLGERTYEKMRGIGHDVLFAKKPRTLVKSGNGTSKDLALDTPILTTLGWSTMGEVKKGDFVFDEQGLPTLVTVKSEIMYNPCYRVTFDDGSSFVAGQGHLWNTINLKKRARLSKSGAKDWRDHWDESETLMTHQIAESMGDGAKNHLVPIARPLRYEERADLPISPYVLGAWLGDGTTIRAEMTCNYAVDGYVIDRIEREGYKMYHRTLDPTRPYSYMAVSDCLTERNQATSTLKVALTRAGVLGNKHIPEQYLSASIEQRIDLLRGLMDTDGWANQRGRTAGFGQSNRALILQFEELLSGLGIRFSTTTELPKAGKQAWTVSFRAWFDPFTPGERKSKVYMASSPKQASRLTGRSIVSVEKTLTVPTACISVESKSHLYLAGKNLVPTHNTFQAGRWVMWWCTVFPPEESLAIVTGPTLVQVQQGIFMYLKERHGYMRNESLRLGTPFTWPGWISEKGFWNYRTVGGNQTLAIARVPSAGSEETFKGLRKPGGRSLIVADEAGGVTEDIYNGIEALMTGGESRMVGIGNPERRGTPFYTNFDTPSRAREFNLHTISGYDLPTYTGEIVYPDDPEKQAYMLAGLTKTEWIFHKERIWMKGGETYFDDKFLDSEGNPLERRSGGEPNGLFRSKVLGEFPGDADNAFFSENSINKAIERHIEVEPDTRPTIGADIATTGSDESVVYVNHSGRLRLFGKTIPYTDTDSSGEDLTRTTTGVWSKEDTLTNARRIHAIAMYVNASEVRLDANAVGSGVATDLMRLAEFSDKCYSVIRVVGSKSSSDASQWVNWRDEIHAFFAFQMSEGLLDIDGLDSELNKELMLITYELRNGAIKIDAKKSMFNEHGGSPDRADAAMYAVLDTSALTDNPYDEYEVGDVVLRSPAEMLGLVSYGAGMPL